MSRGGCGALSNYQFGDTLSLPRIDRIRWHLFPEIRIDDNGAADLFAETEETMEQTLPDIIKIMDIQQEQLARSLGEGHRVIHGVAGSGKTLILGYRCLHLSRVIGKPILVLCFNITLAARLRTFISSRGIDARVQIYHFHDWCREQLKTFHVELIDSAAPVWERQVESVMQAVEKGRIPRAQYGALLIDEGHDFEADWLRLVVQMIDPDSNSLLLLYDDAQSIYHHQTGLGFSLSSVGVKAQGRTTVLRLNYRNTREILHFAYDFAGRYLDPQSADDDHIPLLAPEAAGGSGPRPVVKRFETPRDEVRFAVACVRKWHAQGVAWRDMAVIYKDGSFGREMSSQLGKVDIPYLWMATQKYKSAYDSEADRIALLTLYSSKGLEFQRVILLGIGQLGQDEAREAEDARLLYVGMTRARECLLLTSSADGPFSRRLLKDSD